MPKRNATGEGNARRCQATIAPDSAATIPCRISVLYAQTCVTRRQGRFLLRGPRRAKVQAKDALVLSRDGAFQPEAATQNLQRTTIDLSSLSLLNTIAYGSLVTKSPVEF